MSTLSGQLSPPKTGLLPLNLIRRPFDFWVQAHKEYGDIYTLNAGVTQIIVLNHPRHAQHCLVDNVRNYGKGGPQADAARAMLGSGLPLVEGDLWLRQRRLIQPQFHRKNLMAMTSLMVQAIVEGIDGLEKRNISNQPINIMQEFAHITMKTFLRAMMGGDMQRDQSEKLDEAMTLVLESIFRGMITNSLPSWLPIPGRKRYQDALKTVDQVIFGLIDQKRKQEPSGDLLSMMLNMVDTETGEQMSNQQLRDEVVAMFVAGYDATAVGLAWTLYFLKTRPEVVQKMQDEIETVLGGATPTFKDLPQLIYLRQVFQESLRLIPPLFWIPRDAKEDDEIDGFHIPAGTMVAPMVYTIHRHPEFWDSPEEFRPERFANREGKHKLSWMPFGAGQRQCIGKEFADLESHLILACLLQKFSIRDVPEKETSPKLSVTTTPSNGVWVYLDKR